MRGFEGGVDAADCAAGRLKQRRSYNKWSQKALDHLLATAFANAATIHLKFVQGHSLFTFF